MTQNHEEDVAAWRLVFRRVTPEPVKIWIYASYIFLRRKINNLRWSMMSPQQRTRWTANRMNLDQSQWLFILGVNNSGTTLLTRMLGLHPFIRDMYGEGQRLTECLPNPGKLGVRRLWSHRVDDFRWTEDDDATLVEKIMYDWAPHFGHGAGYLLEKSPPNTVRSRWLQANFQPCRFLVVTRNPYVVAEGIRRRQQCTIEQAIEHWAKAHTVLHEDLPHLHTVLRITYEQLCDHTADVLADVEQFLELPQPFDRDLFMREFDIHNMHDQPALIQNFNQRSIDRLAANDIESINRVAADVLQQFGYELLEPSSAASSSD